uniref:TTL domain-containing protein n=1 Tax=Elaeophora elaphi TaxID=1147741 RepID=A0A0R3RK51_9BILA
MRKSRIIEIITQKSKSLKFLNFSKKNSHFCRNFCSVSFLFSSFGYAEAVARNFTIDTSRAKTNKHVVSICAAKLGMREYPEGREDGGACDIYWHNNMQHDIRSIVKNPQSKINKFPGMSDLSKKISLTRAISSMRRLFPDEYSFYPSSWFIPAQLDAFIKHCDKCSKSDNNSNTSFQSSNWYIVKPDDGAQGTGIYLIQKAEQIRKPEACQLIQEYIADPYLLNDNLKFDFRIYAVIKSINPLSIYVAREGMARFCTEQYATPTSANFDNLYAHLTNYSLNKENNAYIHSLSLRDQIKGFFTFALLNLGRCSNLP